MSVLRSELEIFAQTVCKRKKVQRWWRDNNLWNVVSASRRHGGEDNTITGRRIDIGIVENLDDLLFLFPGRRVHLEISSDEELARHLGDYGNFLVGWWRCGLEDDRENCKDVNGCKSRLQDSATESFRLSPESRALSIPAISLSQRVYPLLDVPFKIFSVNVSDKARRRERER